MKQWKTPPGMAVSSLMDMLQQPHLLIAGSTGSGKSVLINSLVYTALYYAPTEKQILLIDPKRVELFEFLRLPHCIGYASEPDQITNALAWAVSLMEYRFNIMRAEQLKKSREPDIYIIIDEFADLIITSKKRVLPLLSRLTQLGRAANIHTILATQRPTRDIISGQIKVNVDARVALRCPTAQDSRNIINVKGAESLPRYGFGYYLTPETTEPTLISIPYTEPDAMRYRLNWWLNQL